MNRLVIIVTAFFLLAGCISDTPPKPKPRVYQPENAYRVDGGPIVFEGTVESVLPSPGGLSIVSSFFQGARYRVNKVITGELRGKTVVVYHLLVGPPMTDKDLPELSHELFKPGTKLHVRCQRTQHGDYVDSYGVNSVEVIN